MEMDFETFKKKWYDLDASDRIYIYNEAVSAGVIPRDDEMFPMDMLDDMLEDMPPSSILETAYYGGFNYMDDYFFFDRAGRLSSLCELDFDKEYGDMYIEKIYNFVNGNKNFDSVFSDD